MIRSRSRKICMLLAAWFFIIQISAAVGAGVTITVDDSGGANYTKIQDAIDNASAGDTILVYSGTYYENVNVNKQLILRGIDTDSGKPVVDAGGSESVITIIAGNSTVEGFMVVSAGNSGLDAAGIRVNSANNIIQNNTVLNNRYGIILRDSSYNNLRGNNISNNFDDGIVFLDSSSNNIYNNFFNNTNNVVLFSNVNHWNTTKMPGTNIINGSFIGGNVWSHPAGIGFSQTCPDIDSDGICDSPYSYNSYNTDYLPLAYPPAIPDTTPPVLTFTARTIANESTLNQKWAVIEITSNELLSTVLLEWNGVNESMSKSGTDWYKRKISLANGTYTFKVMGSDYFGNWNSTEIRVITVSTPQTDLVAGGGTGNGSISSGAMTWNTSNFPAFWHEDGISGEMLVVLQPDLCSTQRVIDEWNLVYNTSGRILPYKVYTETGLTVDEGLSGGGYYAKAGWLGKPYVAANGQANKLSELVLEQNSTDYRELTVGETWGPGDGYSLTLQSLDTKALPWQAWLVFNNESGKLKDKVIHEDEVFTYTEKSFAGESDVPLFVTYVENITSSSVRLRYTWLISDNVTEIHSGDEFGILEVVSAGTWGFELKNKDNTILSRNTTINLLDGLYLVVNDNTSLEYYPMMTGASLLPTPTPTPTPPPIPPPAPASLPDSRYVWDAALGSNLTYTWTPMNFGGFYYDMNENTGNESLTAILDSNTSRTIQQDNLIYSTKVESVPFNYSPFGSYNMTGFVGEKYFAGYTAGSTGITDGAISTISSKQLHKVLSDDDTKRTIYVGGTVTLGEGYVLKAKDIDITGRKIVLVSLLKDGGEVDSTAVSQGETYVYSVNVGNVSNLSIIAVHVESIFAGTETNASIIHGIFQISESYTSVDTGNQFGIMEVTTVSNTKIEMKNTLPVILSKGAVINLYDNITFNVADSDVLRFYPERKISSGSCQKRGAVYTGSNNVTIWDGTNFPGFWYDLDSGLFSEYLNMTNLTGRTLSNNTLWYNTSRVSKTLKVVENGHSNSEITSSFTDGQYNAAGWMGEPYVAIKGKANKLSRFVIEQGSSTSDKKTLIVNETWDIGDGWTLYARSIDAKADPRHAQLVLSKDGIEKDKKIIAQGEAYVYVENSFAGETDVPLFVTYVDSVFAGAAADMAQLRYTWAVSASVTEIESGDRYGVFEVTDSSADSPALINYFTINLSAGACIGLLGNISLQVADNSSELRFYPVKYPLLRGDLNRNGRRDTGDATLMLRSIVELPIPSEYLPVLPIGDMNCNNRIDTGDATLVLRDVVSLPIPRCWE